MVVNGWKERPTDPDLGNLPAGVYTRNVVFNDVFSRVVYHGVTSSFFGIGILLVSDLLDFRISVGIVPPFFVSL